MSENRKGRHQLGDLDIDGRIKFKWFLKRMLLCGLDSSDLG